MGAVAALETVFNRGSLTRLEIPGALCKGFSVEGFRSVFERRANPKWASPTEEGSTFWFRMISSIASPFGAVERFS